jgi:hypothetical protein
MGRAETSRRTAVWIFAATDNATIRAETSTAIRVNGERAGICPRGPAPGTGATADAAAAHLSKYFGNRLALAGIVG